MLLVMPGKHRLPFCMRMTIRQTEATLLFNGSKHQPLRVIIALSLFSPPAEIETRLPGPLDAREQNRTVL